MVTDLPTNKTAWTVDTTPLDTYLAGLTGTNDAVFNAVTGTLTITLDEAAGVQDFDADIILTPPPDSDVDLTGVDITATATGTGGPVTSDPETFDITVDAIVDGSEVTQPGGTPTGETKEAIPVGLVLDLGGDSTSLATAPDKDSPWTQGGTDDDGSESVTQVVTLSAGGTLAWDDTLTDPGTGDITVVQVGQMWTFVLAGSATQADMEALAASFTVSSATPGDITVTVETTTVDTATDVTVNPGDNTDVDTYQFTVTVEELDTDLSFADILTNSNSATQYYLVTFTQISNPSNTFTTLVRLDAQGSEVIPDFELDAGFPVLSGTDYTLTIEYIGGAQAPQLREMTVEDVEVLGKGGSDDITLGLQGSANQSFSLTLDPETSFTGLTELGWNVIETKDKGGVTLDGTKDPDFIVGNVGNDTLSGKDGSDYLDGDKGDDELFGGAGNDILLWDPADSVVDGGSGDFDVLRVEGATTLDLTGLAGDEITDIEVVDLIGSTPSQDNTLVVTAAEVLAMSSTTDTLIVFGDGDPTDAKDGDTLVLDGGGWSGPSPSDIDSGFVEYTNGGATVVVDEQVFVDIL